MRALDLRQKVIFASTELFKHAVATGLINQNIRSELKTLLQTEGVSDEELLERITLIEANESEREKMLSHF